MHKILGAAVGMVLVLSACTGGSDDGTAKESASAKRLVRDATVVEPAWTTDLKVIGQPEVVDRTAVVIVKARTKELDLVGVDTSTGKIRWQHTYSPGAQANGYPLSPVVVKDEKGVSSVVLLEPPKPLSLSNPAYWLTPVVVLDPATGKERFRTRTVYAAAPLGDCIDEVDACIRASYGTGTDVQNLRIDLTTRKIGVDRGGIAADRRELASAGLFSSDDRPGELIGVERNGKTLWTTPVDDLIAAGRSSDQGWTLNHDEKADVYTGYIGSGTTEAAKKRAQAGKSYEIDLGQQIGISFHGETGKVIWKTKGIASACFGDRPADDVSYDATSNPVRCVNAGTVKVAKGKPTPTGVSVTVEGYDPATGKTVWSADVEDEAAARLVTGRTADVLTSPGTVLLPTTKGVRLYETRTGTSTKATSADLFACSGEYVQLEYVIPTGAGTENETGARLGGTLVDQCTPGGKVVDKPFTVASIKDGGQKVDDSTYVMSRKGELVGFTVPKG